jgi:hypothetical protein
MHSGRFAYPIPEPSPNNIVSFAVPSTSTPRFSEVNFRCPKSASEEADARATPSAQALKEAVERAEERRREKESIDSLPGMGGDVGGLFERPLMPSSSLPRQREDDMGSGCDTEGEEEEEDNEDEGMEEYVFYLLNAMERETMSLTFWVGTSVELNDPVLAPYNKRAGPYRPTILESQQECDWWPAQVVAYIPPPAKRKRSQPPIKGSYRLRYLDGIEKIFTSRSHFCTIHDREFIDHPVSCCAPSALLFYCTSNAEETCRWACSILLGNS